MLSGVKMLDTGGANILVVDDDDINRQVLCEILGEEGYKIREAESGEKALASVQLQAPDMILLDAVMPDIDGFEVAQRLKAEQGSKGIPIIMVTGLLDARSREHGLLQGVEEYITKPVNPRELTTRVRNLLRLKLAADILKNHNSMLEEEVQLRSRELHSSFEEGLYALMKAAEYRDNETGTHIQRISYYTRLLAEELGAGRQYCDTIFMASPMHDIGKIGIPDRILLKAGTFENHEWEVMKTHTTIGAAILGGGISPYMKMGQEIALSHHEHWDGSGYPHGTAGEAIPNCARIMSVCDVYDALRSERPYKESYDHARAVETIRSGDERTQPAHFDPDVLEAFLRRAADFNDIYESMRD